jgi:hypothetical protein
MPMLSTLLLEFRCIPDYVCAWMLKTRALAGIKRDAWGSTSAIWSYHPDTGLEICLVEN